MCLLLVFALALRIAFACAWQARLGAEDTFFFGDSETYWELAQSLAQGEPFQYRTAERQIFRTPGYPLLLAGLFLTPTDSVAPLAGRIATAIMGTLAVAATYWLAANCFGRQVALVAAGIAAVYPGAVVMSGLLLSEAPFTLLMLVQLALWQQTITTKDPVRGRRLAVGTGLVAAAATLVRPSWLLFTPLLAISFGVAAGRQHQWYMVRRMALVCCLLIVGMSPWWIRNWQVVGHFVPTTLSVGASLYDGLHAEATGASDMRYVTRFETTARITHDDGPAEYQLDRLLRTAAWNWAIHHPHRVAQLAAIKFVRLWNVWPNEPSFRTGAVRAVLFVSYLPVVALAIWALIRLGAPLATRWLLFGPAVYFTALHVIFVASIRYRQPAMLTLIVLAAAAIVPISGRMARHGGSPDFQPDH